VKREAIIRYTSHIPSFLALQKWLDPTFTQYKVCISLILAYYSWLYSIIKDFEKKHFVKENELIR
jgi:hypothetical protein